MAAVTRTVYARILVWDPALEMRVPLVGVEVRCKHARPFWDKDLTTRAVPTDADGVAELELHFEEDDEHDLNPYFVITIPQARRQIALPGGWSGDRVELPEEWETEHDERRRLGRLTGEHTSRADAVDVLVGLEGRAWLSSCDAHVDGKGNPLALPGDSLRVHFSDNDIFFDDTLGGWVGRPAARQVARVGDEERYPYDDRWPTAPYIQDEPTLVGRAAVDPPGLPLATLGGGSYGAPTRLACDPDGFVWLAEGSEACRYYPDSTRAGSIATSGSIGGMCCDRYRHLFSTDTSNNRLNFYRSEWTDGRDGAYHFVSDETGFSGPAGVAAIEHPAVDGVDVLAVADGGNARVRLYFVHVHPGGGGMERLYGIDIRAADNSLNRRDGADWPEYFAVGSNLRIPTGANAGSYSVSARAGGKLTLGGGPLVNEGIDGDFWVYASGGNTNGTDIEMTGTGRLRKRGGSFDDAMAPGAYVRVQGFSSWRSIGVFRIASATPTELVLDQASTVAEGAGPNVSVRTVSRDSARAFGLLRPRLDHWRDIGAGAAPRYSVTSISVAAADQSLNDSAGGFAGAGLTAGQFIRVAGFADPANNGNFRIVTASANKLVLAGGGLVDEAAGPNAAIGQHPFQQPHGVAADPQRRLYVADSGRHRVTRWRLDADEKEYLLDHVWGTTDGSAGAGPGEFDTPTGLAVDGAAGYLYVVDSGNNRIQRFDLASDAHLLDWIVAPDTIAVDPRGFVYLGDGATPSVQRYRPFDAGGNPLPDGQSPAADGTAWPTRSSGERMSAPAYVTFDAQSRLWVSDSGNERTLTYERQGDGSYAAIATVGALAQINGQTPAPHGIGFDVEGHVYIADRGAHVVRHFDNAYVAQGHYGGAGAGSADAELDDPRGLAVAQHAEPWIYVADRNNDRINVFRRAGGSEARLTAGSSSLSHPEDVAVDRDNNVYVADTGNRRIVVFDQGHVHQRDLAMPVVPNAGPPASAEPSGIAVDAMGRLLVTDRGRDVVLLLDARAGGLIAYWNLVDLLPYDLPSTAGGPVTRYRPELVRQIAFDHPGNAAVSPERDLLAVADTGQDRVRLLRIGAILNGVFTDLGRGLFNELPDLSVRAQALADWSASLNFRVHLIDGGLFTTDPHQFAGESRDDFSDDHWHVEQRFTQATEGLAEGTNVIRVVRQLHRWLTHLTRQDDVDARWDAARRQLNVDITGQSGSYHPSHKDFLSLNELDNGAPTTRGRGADGWDAYVITHESGHWVFDLSTEPAPAFTYRAGNHSISTFDNESLALLEAYAEYVGIHWQGHDGQSDRLRGYPMKGGNDLAFCQHRSNKTFHYLQGGRNGDNFPGFGSPGRGLVCEGYLANSFFQLHHLIADPGIAFADAPCFWHHFNEHLDDDHSRLYSRLLRQPLRDFPNDPSDWQLTHGASQLWRQILERAAAEGEEWRQLVQAIGELNNQLMPHIVVTEGGSASTAGNPVPNAQLDMREGETKALTIQVLDGRDQPLRGYRLEFQLRRQAEYALPAGPGPNSLHGRRAASTSGWERATNVHGIVHISFTAPAGSAGNSEDISIEYQPDFDTDSAFAGPSRGDDLETVMRKRYLQRLRGAVKLWPGHALNFGARVTAGFRFDIQV